MAGFSQPVDIANRALQHLGGTFITAFSNDSKNSQQTQFAYDKCRLAELRANLWNFSARRVVLRPYSQANSEVWSGPLWSSLLSYPAGSIVNYDGAYWINNTAPSLNQIPGTVAAISGWTEFHQGVYILPWTAGLWYPGEMVTFQGLGYICTLATSATGNQPDVDTAHWLALPIAPTGVGLNYFYTSYYSPRGITTNTLSTPKPAYGLPVGYVRVFPQDPKVPATPVQLSTAGMQNSDYEFEQGFLLTNQTRGGPLLFRFGADIKGVYWMDPLFCEAVAVRMALDLCEVITQSQQKRGFLHGLYEEYVSRAVGVNAIEAGSTEPNTDDVKTNRRPAIEKTPAPQQRQQG